MKKAIALVLLLAIGAFIVYRFFFQQDKPARIKEIPLAVTTNDSLTASANVALQAYYALKDAFVKSDTSAINKFAAIFADKVRVVATGGLEADTAIVELARELQQTIAGEATTIIVAKGIEAKRKTFQPLSDAFYDLLRTVRFNGSKVYQQYCPMAFNNTGAAWLSNSDVVINPYLPEKMLHCGDVRDSIIITK